MAKKSIIAREKRKIAAVKSAEAKRKSLKEAIQEAFNHEKFEEMVDMQSKFHGLDRNTSASRVRRRCRACGRPRGVYRKFGLCRIHLREHLMVGDVAGARKASW